MQYTDDKEFFASFTAREAEAAKLLDGALRGDAKDQYDLKEGISTTDLATALSPTLTRVALNNYAEIPTTWTEYAQRNVLDSFLSTPFYNFAVQDQSNIPGHYSGDQFFAGSLPTVAEYAPYPTISFSASTDTLKLRKSGESAQLSWEAIVVDNQFSLLEQFPVAFARHARGREETEAAMQLVVPGGINTAHFTSGQGNYGTAQLTLASLQNAIQAIALQTYNGNRVTGINRWKLVVPRALALQAQNILNITSLEQDTTSGSTVTKLVSNGNPLAGKIDIVVNDWLSVVAGGTAADKFWFLIPVVGQNENPNVLVNFLRGYEQPEIWIKGSGAQNIDARRGSFDNDSYQTRIRHTASGGWLSTVSYLGTFGSVGTDA